MKSHSSTEREATYGVSDKHYSLLLSKIPTTGRSVAEVLIDVVKVDSKLLTIRKEYLTNIYRKGFEWEDVVYAPTYVHNDAGVQKLLGKVTDTLTRKKVKLTRLEESIR